MTLRRTIVEVFSTECERSKYLISLVMNLADASCDVRILDPYDLSHAIRLEKLDIQSLPAVVVDGQRVDITGTQETDVQALRDAGMGKLSS